MREIKFRAWDKENKRMWFDVQDAYDWQIMNESNSGDGIPSTTFGDILTDDNFIVMQYTGLKDKKGREIYEGDIIQYPNAEKREVKIDWAGGCGCYDDDSAYGWFFETWNNEYVEVIGNIYQDRHLIDNTGTRI